MTAPQTLQQAVLGALRCIRADQPVLELAQRDYAAQQRSVAVGDTVLYNMPGYRFKGDVLLIDEADQRAQVVWQDANGERTDWCGLERLTVITNTSALEIPADAGLLSA